MNIFFAELKKQRWDDHRYYHHSRINQSLHLVSALSFLTTYVFIFTNPVAAALVGWFVAMVTRQAGHFFFEPKDYDGVRHRWFCGSIRRCSASFPRRRAMPTSYATCVRSGSPWAQARCSFARCNCALRRAY